MRFPPYLATLASLLLATLGATGAQAQAQAQAPTPGKHITKGLAEVVVENLYKCPVKVDNHRISAVGRITALDGTVIKVPAETAYERKAGPAAADLYNECTGVMPAEADVSADKVPVVEVDADGEVVTGYIVADNYFELYINGKLVAVDNTPYTPFNASIVKFKAKKPYTYAFKLVDWEEVMGRGSEMMRGDPLYLGDGGLIARFSDGTVTDSTWKAQAFYIGPLNDPSEVKEKGTLHDTTALGRVHPHDKAPTCGKECYAIHYDIPADWAAARFDDSRWPRAYEFTDEDVGVTALPAYTRYPKLFEGSRWIWSLNLVFDNVVIARKTVR